MKIGYDLDSVEGLNEFLRDRTVKFLEEHDPEELVVLCYKKEGMLAQELVDYLRGTGICRSTC